MEKSIFKEIIKRVDDFNSGRAYVTNEISFNQREVHERNLRLYNSKFKKGNIDREGFQKYFYNIVRNPCDVATKAISFNTGDIKILSTPGRNHLKAWLLDRDFKYWAKVTNFAKILKTVFYELPIYGTVVLKKVNGQFFPVDIRNLVLDQSADTLTQSSHLIERHYYSPEDLRKKEGKWDNVEEAIEMWRNTKSPFLRLFEYRGEIPESYLKDNGDPNKYVRGVFIVYSPEQKDYNLHNEMGDVKQGVVLWKAEEDIEEFPYREIHWEKIPGRWLGVGRVELNADPQIRTNEITNLRVKASYFAALTMWQTRDTSAPKNLTQEAANGDVLSVISEITRIPTEDRNLPTFSQEENRWMQNRDENSMSFDVIRGERLPAGTPLGAAQLAAQQTTSYFDDIRERIAIEIKEMIKKDVIKDFLKQNNDEHYLKLTGEDFEKMTSLLVVENTNAKLLDFVRRKQKLPSQTQYEAIRGSVEQRLRSGGGEMSVTIPAEFYDDVDYDVDIVITEEARKIQAQAANMTTVLQAIQQDETILTDPTKRKIFGQLLETIGLSLGDIETAETVPSGGILQSARENTQRGGGISGPVQQDLQGQIEQTV